MKPPVLLLDDQQAFLEIYRRILPQTAYTIETTSSYHEALNRLEVVRHPVVLSDLRLIGIGKQGGFKLLHQAKTISPYTKVIIFTAYGGAATRIADEAMERGAFNYFTKPIDYADLDQCIVMAIQSWRQEVEAMINFGFLTEGPELFHLLGLEPVPITHVLEVSVSQQQVTLSIQLENEIDSLRQQLIKRQSNLYKLREKAAHYSVVETPVYLLNMIEEEEKEIERIIQKIYKEESH